MSIMIDLPPAMAQEAQSYADLCGTTLEKALLKCVAAELERNRRHRANATRLMERWRELVRKGHGRLKEPYKFNRADAYPEGEYA